MHQAQKIPAGDGTPGDHTPPGWLRRLSSYCWRYRRNVLLSFGASGDLALRAGQTLGVRPA